MTTQIFNASNSRKLRLAGSSLDRIAAIVEKQGGKLPSTINTPRQAKDWCIAHGWGWKGNVVNQAKKDEYGAAQSCGDDMAEAFSRHCRTVNPETKVDYLDMDKVREVAKANSVSLDRWYKLNIGQIRMNLGNVLRGKMRRGEKVVVGDKVWNKDAKPVEAKAKKAKAKKTAAKAPKAKRTKKAAPAQAAAA